ncbi:right-handed parallel beta-helix repeat-containing protein [Cellulomonas shaoxiangyii]|uniref:Right-handed parallel beta-helix repeat-containing protein n=1 Tax=Cellulomonas shaoxiangyii TaxID=2566013 RepID=A0A4P7SJQ0_9CELL|nr:right-handed parallel beta-helix repeat-containing protein [Cellulomonas shaoxiangyii]QCB94509.1 right-handed parallel beta-helix repeat-containing protein [Cellulomonas shaoxiangyii]TGY86090.1 right-handed parallel beta-helix repeat-containing protein [Cellulomonas shaoxiangyii]
MSAARQRRRLAAGTLGAVLVTTLVAAPASAADGATAPADPRGLATAVAGILVGAGIDPFGTGEPAGQGAAVLPASAASESAPADPAPSGSTPAGDASAATTSAPATAPTGADTTDELDTEDVDASAGGRPYPGDVTTEPVLVADEDDRLDEIRTVASMVRWRQLEMDAPYRLTSGSTYTLVLTKREAPYTVTDLLALAPQTFVRQPDGAFLLSENVVVQPGATLELSGAGGLTVRLASDSERFVSIVNYGGKLVTGGTANDPVVITSWDRTAGAPDLLTDDGRAYVRAVGGQVDLRATEFRDLGFWSGRTGGVALTGTDRPTGGALEQFGRELRDDVSAMKGTAPATEPGAPPTDAAPPVEEPAGAVPGVLPAGELPLPEVDLDDPSYSYVAARIDGVTFDGNAFGLFLSSANGVDITDTVVSDSLVDGLVLHRFVANAAISATEVSGNAGDGIVLSRATTGIVLSEVSATGNGDNGIELRGESLADGPSATGSPVGDYGNNSVSNSVASDNARYGIEVVGGRNVSLTANDVSGNDMGIVVRDPASEVAVVGNRLRDNARHGIALRDGVLSATVSGNVLDDGSNGIYLRDAVADVRRNTVSGMTLHAVTLVGDVGTTVVTENDLAGRGPSAVDRKRVTGTELEVTGNDEGGWASTKPFWTVVRNAAQPLTVMWVLLGLLVVVTAVRGAGRPRTRTHPYAEQARLSTIVGRPANDLPLSTHDMRTRPQEGVLDAPR